MDKNLIEQLKKLSKQLADALQTLHSSGETLGEVEKEDLESLIADIQDEISVIEDQLEEDAENEYADHHAKGWR